MKLLYPEEHLSCFLYSVGKNPLIALENYEAGASIKVCPKQNMALFLLEGAMHFSYSEYLNVPAEKDDIFIYPANQKGKATFDSDTVILSFQLGVNLSFCDHFSFEMLLKEKSGRGGEAFGRLYFLTVNEIVKAYLDNLLGYLKDGLRCSYFLEMKIKEFFYILRAYYPKEELTLFFDPMMNSDLDFSTKFFQSLEKTSNVEALAQLMDYSLSGFEKRFKKIFGVPAYQWIQREKAKSIYHEINCTEKNFSKIGQEYGFSSPSHFNDFCKRTFGDTPGGLRKKNLKK